MRQFKKTIFGIILAGLLISVNPLSAGTQKTVLFDEGHGQKFLIEQNGTLDLSGLSAIFKNEGLRVKASKGKITDEVLTGVDALVISGAFMPVTPPEIAAVIRFVEKGGRLCIMLHIGTPVADLLHKMNVSISNGVIREQKNQIKDNPLDYYVTELKPHALMRGVKRFSIFGGWALLNTKENAEIIAQTSEKAWVDLNGDNQLNKGDAVQSFGVVIAGKWGAGHFVVFGDDAIFQNKFLIEENALIGKNLARWLKGEKKNRRKDEPLKASH
ncbi:MAG: DUF4350 domain-containing protein [Deltaproteobacteria bacterium]|nr:DUF4350 domain-containing protein [Deltaproteobacteria bacterium]